MYEKIDARTYLPKNRIAERVPRLSKRRKMKFAALVVSETARVVGVGLGKS